MTNLRNYVSLTHQGYMAGLNGKDPDKDYSRSDDYESGWLAGVEDREKGVQANKYLGPCELPIQRGAVVTIPKGTSVSRGREVHVTKRAYKVRLHDVYNGVPAYIDFRCQGTVTRPTAAHVLWAGSGGSWSEALLSDIVIEGTT
jgi:hypothetical protein